MDLYSYFAEDDEACPLDFTPLPYGSPGVDSLLCGRNALTRLDDQWTPNDAWTDVWQQTREQSEQSEFNDIGVSWSPISVSQTATECRLPSSPHGFWDFEFSPTFWKELWTEEASMYPSTVREAEIVKMQDWMPPREETSFGQQFLKCVATVDDNVCCDQNVEENEIKVENNTRRKSFGGNRKKRTRKQKTKKGRGLPKGLTVCLRTLLRQLLAGTSWVIDPSIGRDEACHLIKLLIGSELESKLQIDPPKARDEDLYTEWRQAHYNAILADIMTHCTETKIEPKELAQYVTLRRGPYRLSSSFKALLGGRQWPPCLPNEACLRAHGCYRLGEAVMKKSTDEEFDQDA